MPIRIERDRSSGGYSPGSGRGRGGGGGGGSLIQFIPMLIGLFGRNPKMLILLVVGGAIWYFVGGKGCASMTSDTPAETTEGSFSMGADFDEKKYSATEIYEPLADNKRNPMPEAVSLLKYAPQPMNQGQQGSCVAWASAYAARSIMEARESGSNPQSTRFSPAFLYNQIALQGCQGAYLPEAMKVMKGAGLAPYEDMQYSDQDCSQKPSDMALRNASEFKIEGYQRLTLGDDPKSVDILAIKQNIAQGAPVVIGMMVGGSFMKDMVGKETWIPVESDFSMSGFGGHAMCVIGYDDYKFGNHGGFQIMNSWGQEWGNKGVAWIPYDIFVGGDFVKEAYGLYPMGNADAPKTNTLEIELGIVLNESDANVSLGNGSSSAAFITSSKMKKGEKGGDRFKIMVANNLECYVYIFGQETSGSSYVLFPYTKKHSPFCGITGTRLFPSDHSLYPDDVGTVDYFAVLISQSVIDYDAFSQQISASAGSTLAEKLQRAIGNNAVNTNWQPGNSLKGSCSWQKGGKGMTGAVIEVMK
ncbi:MAG: C1 family peptidase [Flavobacteriales bacterium]|nr:C1 family peptidase [Flavobacteriales bacterium]